MVHLRHDGRQLVYTASVLLILDTIAVALRLLAKQKTRKRFAVDDLWMLLALADTAAWTAVVLSSQLIFMS